MILGVGTDLANIERIKGTLDRFGDRFRNRVFTDIERAKAEARADTPAPMPRGGRRKRRVPRRWAPACAWASRGATWACPTSAPGSRACT